MSDCRTSVQEHRVQAVARFGFTERQARFLVHVMAFAGVFLERQYCSFAGITHGQKTHDFVRKLIEREYVTAITPGALHRGRLYHLHYKPLYESIGEANNRHRRPASLVRMIERLMVLDAVLADRRHSWLATEQDKLAYFKEFLHKPFGLDDLPRVTFGDGGAKTTRYFQDKLPIGLERDYGPRHVFLYLVTRDVPAGFRMFLFRHGQLLKIVHHSTVRVLVPRRFRRPLPCIGTPSETNWPRRSNRSSMSAHCRHPRHWHRASDIGRRASARTSHTQFSRRDRRTAPGGQHDDRVDGNAGSNAQYSRTTRRPRGGRSASTLSDAAHR